MDNIFKNCARLRNLRHIANWINFASTSMMEHENTVEPVFLKDTDMPAGITPLTVIRAVTEVISPQNLEGVQKFMRLWRIYFKTLQSREGFLAHETMLISEKAVPLHNQRPEEKTYKLTIKGLPLSVQNKEVKGFLLSKGIKPASRIMFSYIRDEDGTFTKYKDGNRFLYCYESNTSTQCTQTILGHYCVLYHHPRNRDTLKNSNLRLDEAKKQQYPAKEDCINSLDEAVAPTHQIHSDPSFIGESKQEEGESRKGTSTTQVSEHNPNRPTYKLTIKDLPLSVPHQKIWKLLLSKNIKLSSPILYSYIKDDDGADTTIKDGDRYAYYHPSETLIPSKQTVDGHNCRIHTSSD